MSLLGRALRRRGKAHAFRVLAALISVLLPLQGIAGAMAAIEAPAHYHVRVATAAALLGPQLHCPAAFEAIQYPNLAPHSPVEPCARSAGHSHEASAPDQGGSAPAHAHTPAPHSHHAGLHRHEAPSHLHHASLTAKSLPSTPSTDPHDLSGGEHNVEAWLHSQSTRVGHHAHALADAGVVYLEGDPDRPDSSSAGKHAAAAAADAALTGWWMPMRGAMGAQSLPHARWRYQSHPGTPALRPPAASGLLTA